MIERLIHFASTATQGLDGLYIPTDDLESEIASLSLRTVLSATVILIVLVVIAAFTKDRYKSLKKPLFILITLTVLLTTVVIAGSTIYLNTSADSGGPVHWHADIEFWACGNELELRDPTGFSNKIGTWTLHEHNDHRIHLEGVVVDDEVDASLGKFMYVIGGAVTNEALVVPLNSDQYFEDEVDGDGGSATYATQVDKFIQNGNDGTSARFINGESCGDEEAQVQVFVYQFDKDTNTYSQTKLDDPKNYVISDDSVVPPGDCIIFEFDKPKDKTDKLCEQYGVRDIDRCTQFGVGVNEQKVCEIREVEGSSY